MPHSQTPLLQVPAVPVAAIEQAVWLATQRLAEQQAVLSVQVLLAQHGLPVTPHGLHTLAVVSQASVASPHLAPLVQQGSPAPPHFKH